MGNDQLVFLYHLQLLSSVMAVFTAEKIYMVIKEMMMVIMMLAKLLMMMTIMMMKMVMMKPRTFFAVFHPCAFLNVQLQVGVLLVVANLDGKDDGEGGDDDFAYDGDDNDNDSVKQPSVQYSGLGGEREGEASQEAETSLLSPLL